MMFKNLSVSFAPECLEMIRWSRQFCKLASLHPTHVRGNHIQVSLQTSCAHFLAVGTLSISGFVSENTGLEASCRVAFAIAKDTAYSWGVTYQTVDHGYIPEHTILWEWQKNAFIFEIFEKNPYVWSCRTEILAKSGKCERTHTTFSLSDPVFALCRPQNPFEKSRFGPFRGGEINLWLQKCRLRKFSSRSLFGVQTTPH